MIIVRLMGGLGNQMFQYALGRSLVERLGTSLKLDTSSFPEQTTTDRGFVERNYDLDVFDIDPEFATEAEVALLSKRSSNVLLDRILRKLFGFKNTVVLEPHYHFSRTVAETPDHRYLIGYWQSSRYFEKIEPCIREAFRFREALTPDSTVLMERIRRVDSVCLNIRRGDFVVNQFHGTMGVDYYRRADDILGERVNRPEYFVFSDDIEWCQTNLSFDVPTTYVTHEFAGRKFQDYLRLMSACKHFVIPNSSFAWWAVWFNQDPGKIVIAPKAWFQDPNYDTNDLIPANWIRL